MFSCPQGKNHAKRLRLWVSTGGNTKMLPIKTPNPESVLGPHGLGQALKDKVTGGEREGEDKEPKVVDLEDEATFVDVS